VIGIPERTQKTTQQLESQITMRLERDEYRVKYGKAPKSHHFKVEGASVSRCAMSRNDIVSPSHPLH
jgi:hypothetical protein